MGRKRRACRERGREDGRTVQVLCLGLFYALGMLGGFLYARYCAEDSQLVLSEYLTGYCALYEAGEVQRVSLLTAVRLYFGESLAAFLLGLAALGAVAVPLLAAASGFLTMFAVACFVQVYGRAGCLPALAAFGPRVLFTVPCFLWVAACAWSSALSRLPGARGKRCAPAADRGGYAYRLFVCVVLLILGVCVEQFVTPALFQWALGGI